MARPVHSGVLTTYYTVLKRRVQYGTDGMGSCAQEKSSKLGASEDFSNTSRARITYLEYHKGVAIYSHFGGAHALVARRGFDHFKTSDYVQVTLVCVCVCVCVCMCVIAG